MGNRFSFAFLLFIFCLFIFCQNTFAQADNPCQYPNSQEDCSSCGGAWQQRGEGGFCSMHVAQVPVSKNSNKCDPNSIFTQQEGQEDVCTCKYKEIGGGSSFYYAKDGPSPDECPEKPDCGPDATLVRDQIGETYTYCECNKPNKQGNKDLFNARTGNPSICLASSNALVDCPTNASPQNNSTICDCKTPWPTEAGKLNSYSMGILPSYANGDPEKACPAITSSSQSNNCLPALEDLKNKIVSYKDSTDDTLQTCETRSEKNANIRNTVDQAAQVTSAMLQNSAVNSGSVDKCRQAGLLSNAAGYGVGMINSDCSKEIQTCKNNGTQYLNYKDENQVVAFCEGNGGAPLSTDQQAYSEYVALVKSISKSASEAYNNCGGETGSGNTAAGRALAATNKAITSYVSASQQAAACEQALANTQSFVPLTMNCALSGGVNCPVNCVTNPSDPKCKSVSSTSGSQMAGGSNKLDTSSLATGLNTAGGTATGGGSGLDLSSLNNGSGSTAEAQKLEASGTMFGSAGAASAGGAGGTAAASANATGAEAGEDGSSQGGIGGAFKALRSAAGNLFNGSGLFGSRANSDKKAPSNNLANKGNTSLIRGLANANRNSCFIDSKGQSFCFGPKHKSIFDIMSTQYANQTPSLLRD